MRLRMERAAPVKKFIFHVAQKEIRLALGKCVALAKRAARFVSGLAVQARSNREPASNSY
jgi:hypothetical protein